MCFVETIDDGTQLHVFSGSSDVGHEAVTYVRVLPNAPLPYSRLLFAKSRVAPLRTVTVSRLKLAAARVTVEIYETPDEEVRTVPDKTYFWADPSTVLY